MNHEMAGARFRIDDLEAELRRSNAWASSRGVEVLLADARVVFGRDHLESAIAHAERAKAKGTMVARTLAMETLLYLTGQRQVSDAIRAGGIRKGTETAAIVLFGSSSVKDLLREFGWTRDDSALEPAEKSLSSLGIRASEERTIPRDRRPDLALEKVALLDINR